MDRRFALSSPAGKSLVPLSREDARLDPFFGCTIRKIFGSQWYYGQVIAIDVDVASGERAYHIAYEDGDEEHLSGSEVRNFAVLASRSAPPSEPGSPRRSVVPSHRPSIARTEAPRPSVAPTISQPPAPASFGLSDSVKPFSFWGSMLLAGFTGALMVALVSSFLSFMMSSGDLVDGVGTRMPMPVGLVAPLPPWAEVQTHQRLPKLSPSGGNGPLEELAPALREEVQEKPEVEVANDPPTQPEETLETSEEEQALPVRAPEAEELPEPVETPSKAEDDKDDEQLRDEQPGTQLMDDSALEEDLSVAVAAVMDASGLVVRVVAKSFFRSLEEVWHWILSAFSSSLSGASWSGGAETIDPPAPTPVPEPEEAAGALQSLMTTILVACAGVITILVNIHPPPSVAQELQDVVHIHEAKTVLLPYQAPSPRPSPAAPFPSPPPAPLQQMQKAQVRQILESVNTPARGKSLGVHAEVAATPLKSATGGARTLMSMMGRTPPGGTTLPVAALSERRPPPPPKSLTVGSENMPPRNQEAHCARCASAMPADANFCRYCGQQRGKKVIQVKAATPPPRATATAATATRRETSREPREAQGRAKSGLIVDKPRFRYSSGLKKLKEMGYGDTEEVRDILTKCSGDLSAALRMINGSSPLIRA